MERKEVGSAKKLSGSEKMRRGEKGGKEVRRQIGRGMEDNITN
jgi:hypothetical protein